MSVLFTCATNFEEAEFKIQETPESKNDSHLGDENYLALSIEDDEFYMFLHDIKPYLDEIDNGCADDFLFKLEIYGDEVLSTDRVKSYLNLSKVLLDNKLINYLDENNMYEHYRFDSETLLTREYYIGFAVKLRDMCQCSLKENKLIFVFGE